MHYTLGPPIRTPGSDIAVRFLLTLLFRGGNLAKSGKFRLPKIPFSLVQLSTTNALSGGKKFDSYALLTHGPLGRSKMAISLEASLDFAPS